MYFLVPDFFILCSFVWRKTKKREAYLDEKCFYFLKVENSFCIKFLPMMPP